MKEKPKPGKQPVVKKPSLRMVLDFKLRNYLLFTAGVASIAIGFVSLGHGSITLAPLLLVLGFCVLIPIGILLT